MLIKVTQFLQQPNAKLKHLPDRGFTLVESLMAMVLISIVVVAMTPPIFLAVGTRVQNRRAEQAMQLAQGEIDRIRVLVEQGTYENGYLPDIPDPPPLPTNFKDVEASNDIASPNYIKSSKSCTGTIPYNGEKIPANRVLRIDINSDCKTDFLVQTFRDVGQPVPKSPSDPTPPMAFRMGVRVYAAVAEQNMANLQRERAPLQFTTGLGSQRSHPLAVIYTTIVSSDSATSFSRYNDLLK